MLMIRMLWVLCSVGIYCITEARYASDISMVMEPRFYQILRERYPELFAPGDMVKRYNGVYAFGLGKRTLPSKSLEMPKRERSAGYALGFGKRSQRFDFGIGKRSEGILGHSEETLDINLPQGIETKRAKRGTTRFRPEDLLQALYTGTNWHARILSGLGKRPTSTFDFGLGKRSHPELPYNYIEDYDNTSPLDDQMKRGQPPYSFGIGKRDYKFGIGKRSDDFVDWDTSEPNEFEEQSVLEFDKRVKTPYEFGLGKRGKESYQFGLGKRDRSSYGFGLGKREKGSYGFGLGKRERNSYGFGLGKRIKGDYEFGLGKRGRGDYAFGLGKRSAENYEFEMGKRNHKIQEYEIEVNDSFRNSDNKSEVSKNSA